MTRTAVPIKTLAPTALDVLRDALAVHGPLQPLEPFEYAVGHALFEARSDQRERLTGWLARHLASRASTPTRVLSVGCGDGSVDVRLAATLAGCGQLVDYVGVEPHVPSGLAFTARLDEVAGVHPSVLSDPFAQAVTGGTYDVVLAVHSLYYVADLAATLRRAQALLSPGGELVILHAPRESMNSLVHLLDPGRRQPFSDDVARLLRTQGHPARVTRIDNRLDLTPTGDAEDDRHLLDFTVQARVPDALRPAVRAALAELGTAAPGLVLPHPVDALVVPA